MAARVAGSSWNEAHEHALKLADDGVAYIHPFDDPIIWRGHSSLIDEVAESGLKPDAVVTSVGGAGLTQAEVQTRVMGGHIRPPTGDIAPLRAAPRFNGHQGSEGRGGVR